MPINRSCQSELAEGATDGKYRKARPNTAVADIAGHDMMMRNRAPMSKEYYGPLPLTQEYPDKVRPA
jgi:hypothetical protein